MHIQKRTLRYWRQGQCLVKLCTKQIYFHSTQGILMFDAVMNFGLGEEIDALRETVRRFA